MQTTDCRLHSVELRIENITQHGVNDLASVLVVVIGNILLNFLKLTKISSLNYDSQTELNNDKTKLSQCCL